MHSPQTPQLLPLTEPLSSPREVELWTGLYKEVARDEPGALSLLCAWSAFCHALDDCVDRDKPVAADVLVEAFVEWTLTVAGNPFFGRYSAQLVPLVVASANAFLDAEEWAKSSDEGRRRFADAWRSFFSQFIFYVAFLVGGFPHMRAMSRKIREAGYDAQHEQPEPAPPSVVPPAAPVSAAPPLRPLAETEVAEKRHPVRPQIVPYQVRTPEEWARLRSFAESFSHGIDQRFPHLVVRDTEDRWIGYAAMLSVPAPGATGCPVLCTAWHPEVSRRDCVEGMKLVINWALVGWGRFGTVIPKDSPLLPHMEALGLEPWNLDFWMTKG